LANYMIDFNLGVATSATYTVKRIDSDYFTED
jgi:restriction endonuclease Mrr